MSKEYKKYEQINNKGNLRLKYIKRNKFSIAYDENHKFSNS